MRFSRQAYWSGLPFPSPDDLPDPGIEPRFPALQADSLQSETQGSPSYKKMRMRSFHKEVDVSAFFTQFLYQEIHVPGRIHFHPEELGLVTSEKRKGKNATTLMRKVSKRTKSLLTLCLKSVWHPLPNILC